MQVIRRKCCVLRGLALLFLVGCHTYHPYGAGRYPGIYGVPPGGTVIMPGTQVVPGGTVLPNNGTLGTPRTIQPNGKSSLKAPPPGRTGSTGSFSPGTRTEANRENGNRFPSEKPVPQPFNEPNSFQPTKKAGGTESGKSPRDDKGGLTPFGSSGANATGGNAVQLAAGRQAAGEAAESRFSVPRKLPSGDARPLTAGNATGQAPARNPYDYDHDAYTWLRGKVDYDEGSKSWQIIYSLNPQDKYGGSLTLIDNPALKKLQNDDVAFVEGVLEKVAAGVKPRYQIYKLIAPLFPKEQVRSGDAASGPILKAGTSTTPEKSGSDSPY